MQRFLIIAIIILSSGFTKSPTKVENIYIKSGENLTFVASFKMSGIMTDIAEVKMITSTIKTKSRELLRLKCTATTYANWDTYFKVRDLYESYVDPNTLLPSLFKRNIEEGTYKKEIKYLFRRNSKTATSTLNKKGFNNFKTEIPIETTTLDIVSTIYKARILNYENMEIGKSTEIELIVDSEIQWIHIKYLGKEMKKVANYGSKECYKLSIGLEGDEIKDIKGNKFIWITADNDRLPVLIKANIPVGSIQLRLSNFTK